MKLTTFNDNIHEQIRTAVLQALPGADLVVQGNNGHFTIEAAHEAFAGKSPVAQQRLVLGAIKHLMAGDNAPVHAIDSLKLRAR